MLPFFLLQVVWPWQFYQLVPAISSARSLSLYFDLDLTENKTNISICWYAVALSIVVKIRISNTYLVKVIKRGIVSLWNNASKNRMYVYTRSFSSIHDLGLWCLTTPSTIFLLYCVGQLYWWMKQEYRQKTNDFPQVTTIRSWAERLLIFMINVVWIKTLKLINIRIMLH